MSAKIVIRPMQSGDGPALAALYAGSPDTGAITLKTHYLIDPLIDLTASYTDFLGVVAVEEQVGLVGAGFIHSAPRRVAGTIRPCVVLSGLVVHPAFRGQGIATQLAQWRVAQARQRWGPDVILLAGVQHNNTRSLAVAHRWMNTVAGTFGSVMVRPRRRPPELHPGWQVRPATMAEWPELADNLARFYADYEYTPTFSAESLQTWLRYAPTGQPLRTIYVVADSSGELLAGCSVSQSYRVRELHIDRLPTSMQFANRLLHVVPTDGVMHPISLSHLWHRPGRADALHDLWHTIAWREREQANALVTYYDPRSQLPTILGLSRWLPKGRLTLVTWQDQPSDPSRLIFPPH